jgi:hypothetical protein
MTEAEKRFLDRIRRSLLESGTDNETVNYLVQDMQKEKEVIGGNLLAICWAVLIESGFYRLAQEIQTWRVE